MKITPLVAILWSLNLLLKCVLCGVIVRRKLYDEIPVFSWYTIASTIWDVVIAICLLEVSYFAYFISFWVFEGLSVLCDCWILMELYGRILAGYERVRILGNIVLRCSFVLLLMTGFSLMTLRPHGGDDVMMGFLLVLSRSVKFMQLGLVMVVFGFAGYFHIPLKRQDLGVAVGIGIIAAVNMAIFATRTHLGWPHLVNFLDTALMSGYAAGALSWIWFLSRSEKLVSTEEAPDSGDLRRWNKTLTGMLNR